MTPPPDELDDAALRELLASASVWIEPDPATEQAVVDTIASERMGERTIERTGERTVDRRGRSRQRILTTAAAIVLLAGAAVIGSLALARDAAAPGVAVALASIDPSSAMTASATVERRPGGVRIVLDAKDLPPARAGTFYQAWLTNDVERVSAGTFHLRGDTGQIELWCGIDDPSYSTLAVTLEEVGGEEVGGEEVGGEEVGGEEVGGGSGPIVLTGRIDR